MINFKNKLLLALFNGQNSSFNYKNYQLLYALFPQQNPASIRIMLEVLKKEGMVEKIEHNNKVSFNINSFGRQQLLGTILDRFYQEENKEQKEKKIAVNAKIIKNNEWDGKYRLLIVHVPEVKRTTRQRIKELLYKEGFRHWQQSIWLYPLTVQRVWIEIKKRRWVEYISLVETNTLFQADKENTWPLNLWNLINLRKNYQSLIKKTVQFSEMNHIDAFRYTNLEEWELELLDNFKQDPLFPDKFFELGNLRETALRIFLQLVKKPIL